MKNDTRPSGRDHLAVKGSGVEHADPVTRAYRRGYHSGATMFVVLSRAKWTADEISAWIEAVGRWRFSATDEALPPAPVRGAKPGDGGGA